MEKKQLRKENTAAQRSKNDLVTEPLNGTARSGTLVSSLSAQRSLYRKKLPLNSSNSITKCKYYYSDQQKAISSKNAETLEQKRDEILTDA